MDNVLELAEKLQRLKQLDRSFEYDDARYHRYGLHAPLPEKELLEFEHCYGVTLPEDYRQFLLLVGNGGAGPGCSGFYGISHDNLSQRILSRQPQRTLAVPFPFSALWCPRCSDKRFSKRKLDTLQWQGSLCIGSYGCSLLIHLVVSGEPRGGIWVDDFGSDNGIWPHGEVCRCFFDNEDDYQQALRSGRRYTFFEWYDEWLTTGLQQCDAC
jgi:SMI1 / KNR4 family (SUKH-1)